MTEKKDEPTERLEREAVDKELANGKLKRFGLPAAVLLMAVLVGFAAIYAGFGNGGEDGQQVASNNGCDRLADLELELADLRRQVELHKAVFDRLASEE